MLIFSPHFLCPAQRNQHLSLLCIISFVSAPIISLMIVSPVCCVVLFCASVECVGRVGIDEGAVPRMPLATVIMAAVMDGLWK